MTLLLSRSVLRALADLPPKDREGLMARLQAIAADPNGQHPAVDTMKGKPPGRRRVRHGNWRAVFVVHDGNVEVLKIADRREVYD